MTDRLNESIDALRAAIREREVEHVAVRAERDRLLAEVIRLRRVPWWRRVVERLQRPLEV